MKLANFLDCIKYLLESIFHISDSSDEQTEATKQVTTTTTVPNTTTVKPIASTTTSTTPEQSVSVPESHKVKITFYDPKVLGATTMPGGMYSGVAANLNTYPKGTKLQIILPDNKMISRVVNDTGEFAESNPYQLDVAWPNDYIPSYGVGVGTATVIK